MASHVFVGGTGRSGTTAVSRLVGQYPRHHHIDIEVKAHCVPGGLVDVAAGEADPARFVDRVKNEWWFSGWEGGGRGLHWLHRGGHIHRACERFLEQVEVDSQEACRLFVHDLLDPLLPIDRDHLVEMSPPNAMVMPQLATWFPLATFLVTVRDGRDVVSSVLRQPWGPTTWSEGLAWWANGVRRGHVGAEEIGRDKVLFIQLDELTGADGEDVQTQLIEFLGVADSEGVRNYRRHRMDGRANVGRWSGDLDDETRRSVEQSYDLLLGQLQDEGVTDLPNKA